MLLFFFNDTATTEIYTLSLHDALPISRRLHTGEGRSRLHAHRGAAGQLAAPARLDHHPTPGDRLAADAAHHGRPSPRRDRKSTRLNSSHANISYAVFCLKKKNKPHSSQ